MAYTTTQFIDNLKVENLIFIPANNQNISSGYSLYINDAGQLYWAAALDADSLSTFSTSVYSYIQTNDAVLSTNIGTVQNEVNYQSTTISSLNAEMANLSTYVTVELSSFYQSTIFIMTSTLYGFSTFSSFYTEIDALDNKIEAGLSSLSTALYIQNASTYNSLLDIMNSSIQSSINYTTDSIASLSSIVAYQKNLSTFSSIITLQLLSTTAGSSGLISTATAPLYTSISTLTISTNTNYSTSQGLLKRVVDLETFSTSMSTVTYVWISSYVSTSQALQDIYIYKSISSLSSVIGSNQTSTLTLIGNLSSYISSIAFAFVDNTASISTLTSEVSSINSQLYVLSTNYILKGIFDSFVQLEQYSADIVNSTVNSVTYFYSSVYYSTGVQNMSISQSYYDTFFSTLLDYGLSSITSSIIDYISVQTSTIFGSTFSAYLAYVSTLTFSVSSIYTNTSLTLHDSNYNESMDFSKYRNFEITVYNVQDGLSNYSLTYNPAGLIDLDYNRGVIFIHISTPTQSYTRNGGKLQFDVYRWGIPTTVWGNFYPTIGNSQYTLEYEYTILRNTIYTNLLNIYPILYVSSLTISSYVSGLIAGSNVLVSWTNYNGLNPLNLPGAPPFDPTISLELYSTGTLMSNYGPFPFNSSATIVMTPYNNTMLCRVTGNQDSNFIKQVNMNL